jgi:hypothetical protein
MVPSDMEALNYGALVNGTWTMLSSKVPFIARSVNTIVHIKTSL